VAKKEAGMQGMIIKLIKTGKCCGMEMNMKKTEATRISRESAPLNIMIDQKQL
jgi:hypothetical protein